MEVTIAMTRSPGISAGTSSSAPYMPHIDTAYAAAAPVAAKAVADVVPLTPVAPAVVAKAAPAPAQAVAPVAAVAVAALAHRAFDLTRTVGPAWQRAVAVVTLATALVVAPGVRTVADGFSTRHAQEDERAAVDGAVARYGIADSAAQILTNDLNVYVTDLPGLVPDSFGGWTSISLNGTNAHTNVDVTSARGFVCDAAARGIRVVLWQPGNVVPAMAEDLAAALAAGGVTPADVLDRPFWDAWWWSYDPAVQQRLRESVARAADGHTCRYDVQVRVADGSLITIDFQLAPLVEDGAPPWPQLVTLGLDKGGHRWLYNLEEAGVLRVIGDPDRARDFVRHAAADGPVGHDEYLRGVLQGAVAPGGAIPHATSRVAACISRAGGLENPRGSPRQINKHLR